MKIKNAKVVNRAGTPDAQILALAKFIGIDFRASPFTPLALPPLEEAEHGDWSLEAITAPPLARGYYRGLMPTPRDASGRFFALYHERKLWMSAAMMELESQAQMVGEAKGHVLVGGLGMGVAVYNLLKKPDVSRVTVIDREGAVQALLSPSIEGWFRDELKHRARSDLHIITADLLAESTSILHQRYDYGLVDIWPCIGDSALRSDMQSIMRRFNVGVWGAWGIELDFVTWCIDQRISSAAARADDTLFKVYAREVYGKRNRLVGEDDPRTVALSFEAAMNAVLA